MSKFTGEVPFPLVEGALLRFTGSNLLALEEKYRKAYEKDLVERPQVAGYAFHAWYFAKLELALPEAIMVGLQFGLKKPGGKDPFPLDVNDLGFPLRKAVRPLMDAINLAVNGETYTEVLDRIIREEEERTKRLAAADGLTPEDTEGLGEMISPPGQPEI